MSMFRNLIMQQGGSEVPLYAQILERMAEEKPLIKSALVAWHCPNLQRLTNRQLQDSFPNYQGGLVDLSGNGHNMNLYSFLGETGCGYINNIGNLVFDGVNNSAEWIDTEAYTDLTFVAKWRYESIKNNVAPFSRTHSAYYTSNFRKYWLGSAYGYNGYNGQIIQIPSLSINTIYTSWIRRGTLYCNGSYYSLADGSYADVVGSKNAICKNINGDVKQNIELYTCILFNRTLTNNELTYVLENLVDYEN